MITNTVRQTVPEARPRRVTSALLWAAQILLAAFFLFVAVAPKLAGSHASVQEFGLIGAGQWFRYLVGTLELAGAIGLVTPWLAGLAAAGLAADMAGATITNATVLRNTTYGPNVWLTAILCAVLALLAYARRQQIKGLAAGIRRGEGNERAGATNHRHVGEPGGRVDVAAVGSQDVQAERNRDGAASSPADSYSSDARHEPAVAICRVTGPSE